jgi:rhodanese-related sulfurtransferase
MKPFYFLIGIAMSAGYITGRPVYTNYSTETIPVDSVVSQPSTPQYTLIRHLIKDDSIFSLQKEVPIVIVCRSGKRSENAKTFLTHQGFITIYNGGGWEKLNELLIIDK